MNQIKIHYTGTTVQYNTGADETLNNFYNFFSFLCGIMKMSMKFWSDNFSANGSQPATSTVLPK